MSITTRIKSLVATPLFAIGLSIVSLPALADRGVIVMMNSKCFVIENSLGYVLVDGYVNASKGTVVIGEFNTYGSTKMYDTNGRDVSGYIYIDEWGLSKSQLIEKWKNKCDR